MLLTWGVVLHHPIGSGQSTWQEFSRPTRFRSRMETDP
jgi:hypothetical protein